MIEIHNNLDPECEMYYNGKCIGKVANHTALLDACAQICTAKEEGYSIKYNGELYPIHSDGRVYNPSKKDMTGFYDHIDSSLKILIGF